MVSRVAENPEELKLGGEERELTLLFCDVRGFTPISELFDPQGLTALINKLLTPLTNQIMARQGTVDKYMGDCIMAFGMRRWMMRTMRVMAVCLLLPC